MQASFKRLSARVVVILLGLCATLMTTALAADEAKRIRIAALIPGPPACPFATNPSNLAYQRRLQEAGYGAALQSQYCYLTLEDVHARVRQILDDKPDLLLIWGSAIAAREVKDASATLPVVFVDVADPVKNGLVQSLAHPGTNMTGITNIAEELAAKRVQLLKEALPRMTRLALLANLKNPQQPDFARLMQDAARALQIETKVYQVETQPDLSPAFAAMERDHMQAVLPLPDVWFYPNRLEVVALASSHHLPAMYGNTAFADAGGLLTFGANLSDMSMRSVIYIDKILKGAKPGDLPVERPEKFDFIVNAKTAHDLGVTLAPATLLRATQVIE